MLALVRRYHMLEDPSLGWKGRNDIQQQPHRTHGPSHRTHGDDLRAAFNAKILDLEQIDGWLWNFELLHHHDLYIRHGTSANFPARPSLKFRRSLSSIDGEKSSKTARIGVKDCRSCQDEFVPSITTSMANDGLRWRISHIYRSR